MHARQTLWYVSAVFMLLISIYGLYAQGAYEIAPVAATGDDAPVAKELVITSSPSLNEKGQVAFTGDAAVFLASGDKQVLIAGFGDPAPDGGTFITASLPSLNAQGQVAFFGSVTPPGRSGIFLFSEGEITGVVQVGDAAPGGGTFTFVGSPALNGTGQVAFTGFASMPARSGVFLYSEGTFTTLVQTGDPAPGGGTFTSAISASLNDKGQVAFFATLSSPSGQGIFLSSEGKLTRVVRTGDPVPDGGTVIASGFTPFSLNNNGQVAFVATASPSFRQGLFLFSEGKVTRIVQTGDTAPGGDIFINLSSPVLNDSEQVAFAGTLSPTGSGIFLSDAGEVRAVVRSGDASPEGDTFTSSFTPSLNSLGQVAFIGRLTDQLGGVYLSSDEKITRIAGQGDPVPREPKLYSFFPHAINAKAKIIFQGSMFPGGNGLFDEALTLIARVGDPAPQGGVFTSIGSASLSDKGDVAFGGSLSTGGAGAFLYAKGKVRVIAQPGDPAPDGGTFFSVSAPALNAQGQAVFTASLSAGGSGVFLFSEDKITTVLRSGDPAPDGGTFVFFSSPVVNDQGDVAFLAVTTASSQLGLYLLSKGDLTEITRAGNEAPGGGTFRFIFGPLSINATDQVAFTASLAMGEAFAGTGVFLSSQDKIIKVARPGDAAPGGGTFTFADTPSLNEKGQIAFPAGLSTGGFGAFLFSGDAVDKIARPGDAVPGGGTLTFANFPKLNAAGQVAFVGGLSTGGNGIFFATPK